MNKAIFAAILTALVLLSGCSGRDDQDQAIWRNVSLENQDKDPYGGYLVYHSLPQYFPGANIQLLSTLRRYDTFSPDMLSTSNDSASLLVLAGLNFNVSDEEWSVLKTFVNNGNELFIVCSNLGANIEKELEISQRSGGEADFMPMADSMLRRNLQSIRLEKDSTHYFGFYGRPLHGYFRFPLADSLLSFHAKTEDTVIAGTQPVAIDTALQGLATTTASDEEENDESVEPASNVMYLMGPKILGRHRSHRANFVRYRIGSGHITLHAAPLAFSNYFLLQKDNRAYLDGVWHTFPANISHIYWNSFRNRYIRDRSEEQAGLHVLMRFPQMAWAASLAFIALLVYILFNLKRRQRIIPVVPPVENESVSFVETVGRLYYNRRNHNNLAEKMIQHFLEWVRQNYFLDTAHLNEDFARQLAAKSGRSEAEIHRILQQIHAARIGTDVTEASLYSLYQTFQSFYKK